MNNYYVEKQTEGERGVYIIVNICETKAYVGKTNNFQSRLHNDDLKYGSDNQDLSDDYKKGKKLIYFKLCYANDIDNELLLNYEKLYMTVVEDYGEFELYNSNDNPKKENRTLDKLKKLFSGLVDDFDILLQDVKNEIDADFKWRFGMTMKELHDADYEGRQNALDEYWNKKESFTGITPYFSKKDLSSKLNLKEYSIKDINLERLIVTSAGTYLNESIEKILGYEVDAINQYGYCLWTFAKNKINTQFGRDFCEDWCEETGNDIYLLIRYTRSGDISNENKFSRFDKKDFFNLSEEEQRFLLGKEVKNNQLLIPEGINSTGTQSASHAFVIEEFGYLKEDFSFEKFKKMYCTVTKTSKKEEGKYSGNINAVMADAESVLLGQSDTRCLCIKKDVKISEIENWDSEKTNYIVAKLRAPYIVDIE